MHRYIAAMAFLSAKALDPVVQKRVDSELEKLLEVFGRQRKSKVLWDELLTHTERLLFAKRLAAILMLHRGCSYYELKVTLRMSTSTSKRLHGLLLKGDFDHVVQSRTVGKQKLNILSILEKILQAGMPPQGRGRWKHILKSVNRTTLVKTEPLLYTDASAYRNEMAEGTITIMGP